ncbi:TerC family protein [Rhodospirillum centenum]|uniref:Integral membrane protein TerC family n=1 Tax=Rhodospirillum centenum (strain ATCC 51521 / SW) TaxID=414684 RepID=B6IWQ6_RHOCS|nr:TerC family protein [Rhodospirillum centenum]ACJ00730.1 Integral membrane protein TerC family [Rhodospirillum centenum SW]
MEALLLLLSTPILGKAAWLWFLFIGIVAALLVFDLGVLNRKDHEIGVKESLWLSAFYILIAVAFGGWLWWYMGPTPGMQYFTGFALEKALALDNVFVISLIFSYFAIPRLYQHRVLFWGILGVILLRGLMIGLGAALVTRFDWVLYIFGAFLLATGVKMLLMSGEEETDLSKNRLLMALKRRVPVTDRLHGNSFFVREPDPVSGRLKRVATPLFLALLMVEIADLVFAVDSVPAIFAITTDPFIVYTSNIFAILGLRALYFALAAMVHRFRYLKYALSLVLVFIGAKIFWNQIYGKVDPAISLSVTFALLASGVLYSLWKTGRGPTDTEHLPVQDARAEGTPDRLAQPRPEQARGGAAE